MSVLVEFPDEVERVGHMTDAALIRAIAAAPSEGSDFRYVALGPRVRSRLFALAAQIDAGRKRGRPAKRAASLSSKRGRPNG